MRIQERLLRAAERGMSRMARAAWPLIVRYNARFERPSPSPSWAPGPLPKRRERSFPQLGWPRETDSLGPGCVKEVRAQILSGEKALSTLTEGRPGDIRARIVEDGGLVKMLKYCPRHGAPEADQSSHAPH